MNKTQTEKSQWKLIAGRGEGQSMNWGFDDKIPETTYRKWYDALKSHIGEKIVLTGGGGFGCQFGTLAKVSMVEFPRNSGKQVLQTTIENCYDPQKTWREPETFEPYINSWQLWIKE